MQFYFIRANLQTNNHADCRPSKKDLPLRKCYGTSREFDLRVIDQCNVPQKLMTPEALLVAQKKPLLNTRDENRCQELTLKY